ncbi:hypothetical protein [Afipia sp. OHSU_I-C4]|uniref:hypothetical protein n=1 Tax=Afipia sp. OHSU_I-C4 TaxID=1297863 RepID=UPI00040A7D20|nr:hypothetical protein [Afipia sp. OHSU_I-C4]
MTTTFGGYGSPLSRGRHCGCGAIDASLGCPAEPRQFAFTHFVDAIFTTLLETLFTKAFDVIARFQARACVWRAGRGD